MPGRTRIDAFLIEDCSASAANRQRRSPKIQEVRRIDAATVPGGRAVERALDILDYLASQEGAPATVTDLAYAIGAARATTNSACSVLEARRLIQREGDGYRLGWGLLELGSAHLYSFDQVREFHRASSESTILSRELVHAVVLEGRDVLHIARHEGRAPLLRSARVGERTPAHTAAMGAALLAQFNSADLRRWLAGWRHETSPSDVDLDALLRRLDLVRDRGFAVDAGKAHPAVVAIAAAVPSVGNLARFAVEVSLIGRRPNSEEVARFGRAIRLLAAQLSGPRRRG